MYGGAALPNQLTISIQISLEVCNVIPPFPSLAPRAIIFGFAPFIFCSLWTPLSIMSSGIELGAPLPHPSGLVQTIL
jgi:hypothetical protein